jgi:hypothetical protein
MPGSGRKKGWGLKGAP